MLALLARLAVGIAMPALMSAAAIANAGDVLGTVVMCAAQTGGPADQGAMPSDRPSRAPADHCPVCTLLAAFALAITAPVVGPVLAWIGSGASRRHAASPLPGHAGLGLLRSRGPPLSA